MNSLKKKIPAYAVVGLMIVIFLLDILTVALFNRYEKQYPITKETFAQDAQADRIHFLNTGNSDSILLESNGHFALVDAGNGSDNPRGKAGGPGTEEEIAAYLKKVAGDADGRVTLDFILSTHGHYDHMGGFAYLILDPAITIEKAYIKPFDPDVAKGYEVDRWGLETIYDRTVSALAERGTPLVSNLPTEPFSFGDFTIQFFNTQPNPEKKQQGENSASVGTKITKGAHSAFLAADIPSVGGLEKELAPLIGQVDVLKLGHHGYAAATSGSFLRALRPKIAVVTNHLGKIYPNVKWNLTMITHTATYATVNNNGLIVAFPDSGDLVLTNHAQDGISQ